MFELGSGFDARVHCGVALDTLAASFIGHTLTALRIVRDVCRVWHVVLAGSTR
jgi:hypothetical protein